MNSKSILILTFLLFHCTPDSRDPYPRRFDDDDDRGRRSGESLLRQVNLSSNSRFVALNRKDFSGARCSTKIECEEICEDIFSRTASRCKSLPEDMVDLLYETYRSLEAINASSLERADPIAAAYILEKEPGVFTDLLRSWGVRGAKEFLRWIAMTPLVSLSLENEDKDYEFFSKLLAVVGGGGNPSEEKWIAAVNENLGAYRETYFYLVEQANNIFAIQLFLNFVNTKCTQPSDCQFLALCQRRSLSDRRGFSVRGSNSLPECPYHDANNYLRGNDHCYAQGPEVWDYINELIADDSISDERIGASIDEEVCDNFCSNKDCEL